MICSNEIVLQMICNYYLLYQKATTNRISLLHKHFSIEVRSQLQKKENFGNDSLWRGNDFHEGRRSEEMMRYSPKHFRKDRMCGEAILLKMSVLSLSTIQNEKGNYCVSNQYICNKTNHSLTINYSARQVRKVRIGKKGTNFKDPGIYRTMVTL